MAKKRRRLRLLLNRQNLIALAVLLLSLLVYAWVSTQVDANLLTPVGLQQAVTNAGVWGILVYIAVIALAVVMSPIPGAPLTIAAGAVWGAFRLVFTALLVGFQAV